MATNPILTMTVPQLKEQLTMYQDMVNMLNSGASGAEIGAKYGRYPASIQEGMVTVNALKAELIKRGEIVEETPVKKYDTGKNIKVTGVAVLLIIGFIFLIGKIKS